MFFLCCAMRYLWASSLPIASQAACSTSVLARWHAGMAPTGPERVWNPDRVERRDVEAEPANLDCQEDAEVKGHAEPEGPLPRPARQHQERKQRLPPHRDVGHQDRDPERNR